LAISRAQRGFSLVEVLVVLALFTVGLLAATPFAAPMIRRAGCFSAISTIRTALALARLQAVKSGANVVVVFSQNSFGGIHLLTFQDKADLTSSSPNDGDSLQEAGEPTLGEIDLSTNLRFWQSGAAVDDLSTGAAFDGYLFNGAVAAGSAHRIVFLPTGGIAVPQAANSGTPRPMFPFGRGIYFADSQGQNFFRITVASTLSADVRVEKYAAGAGYVGTNWAWQ
jgi:prepilin-type N-terminal cleavage/methylation domain-containing protein